MHLYMWAMFFILAAMLRIAIFAYAVTDKGSGRPMYNRAYEDYYLQDYSGWLRDRVTDPGYWANIGACIKDSVVCSRMSRQFNGVPETVDMFNSRKLSPIESGCCKPPTKCGYMYVNETMWNAIVGVTTTNPDCEPWSNEQEQLCKAGVLASLKMSWRKVSIINIVALILLVIFYVVAYAALWNNK